MLSPEQFCSMLRAYRLEARPSVDEFRYLQMKDPNESRFWVPPGPAQEMISYLKNCVGGLDDWREAILWPRHARWVFASPPEDVPGMIANSIVRVAGIAENAIGAAIVDRTETDALVSLLFAHAAFGVCTHDDLYLIPDHGEQLLHVDHHGVVHVTCRTFKRMRSFVEHMARKGYALPSAVPDATFKSPAWMSGEQQHGT